MAADEEDFNFFQFFIELLFTVFSAPPPLKKLNSKIGSVKKAQINSHGEYIIHHI